MRRAASQVEETLEDDEPTDATQQTPVPGAMRMSLKRRITRPSFMIELTEGAPVGEYEIQTQIGEGAMGTVYSAVHPLIGKKVAIKVLKPELCANQATIDRFVTEAQAVNKIGHPNIVDVFSLGELPDGRAYMVMEWLRGEDLKTRLARGPVSVADTCDVLDGIARALDAAHAKQIVHRDLKPDNVFLHKLDDGPLMVKLLDFGIAKLVRVTPGTEKTQTGNMLGTPKYISPEQARGVSVDHRSDIYSLGVMAYEMLAGRPPFQGETAMDIVVQHLGDPPPPLGQFAKLPKTLEQCVMRMLEKEPANRPSLEEVRGVLNDPQKRLTPLPQRMSVLTNVRPSRTKPIVITIAVVVAAGLGVVTWKLVDSKNEPTAEVAPQPAVAPAPPPVAAPVPAPPPAPAPPAVVRAKLEINVNGTKDATIYVDGDEKGHGSQIKVEVDPGKHQIVVKTPGRPEKSQDVELTEGQERSVGITVPPAPHGGTSHPSPQHKEPKQPNADDLMTPKHGH